MEGESTNRSTSELRHSQTMAKPAGIRRSKYASLSLLLSFHLPKLPAIPKTTGRQRTRGPGWYGPQSPAPEQRSHPELGIHITPVPKLSLSLHHCRLPFPPLPSPSLLVLLSLCQVDWAFSSVKSAAWMEVIKATELLSTTWNEQFTGASLECS